MSSVPFTGFRGVATKFPSEKKRKNWTKRKTHEAAMTHMEREAARKRDEAITKKTKKLEENVTKIIRKQEEEDRKERRRRRSENKRRAIRETEEEE